MRAEPTVLRDAGRLDEDPEFVPPLAERRRLVDKARFDVLDAR